MARAGQLELGHRDAREPAQVADGEIDLADQQHEDDADRDHGHAGHLADQVHEVDRGEEVRRLVCEERGDRDDPDDHRQAADVAALQGLPARAQYGRCHPQKDFLFFTLCAKHIADALARLSHSIRYENR